MSDGFSSSKFVKALDPEDYAVGAVAAGATIDCAGYQYAVFVLAIGDCGGTYTLQIESDSDSAMGSPADVAGAIAEVIATDDDSTKVVAVKCEGTERYLRIKADAVAGGVVDLAAVCVLTNGINTSNYATAPDAVV